MFNTECKKRQFVKRLKNVQYSVKIHEKTRFTTVKPRGMLLAKVFRRHMNLAHTRLKKLFIN